MPLAEKPHANHRYCMLFRNVCIVIVLVWGELKLDESAEPEVDKANLVIAPVAGEILTRIYQYSLNNIAVPYFRVVTKVICQTQTTKECL